MPDNEVKSWGQYGPNNKYFRGLQGLKFDSQDISQIFYSSLECKQTLVGMEDIVSFQC